MAKELLEQLSIVTTLQDFKVSSPLCSFKHELSQSWWYLLKHVSHHYTVKIYLSNIPPPLFCCMAI